MNSFKLTLSEKHFICPSILNDSFAGYSNLGCRSLPVSFLLSNQLIVLWAPLHRELSPFLLLLLRFSPLSLILGNVIMMCLGVCFLCPTSLGLSELPGLPGSLFPSLDWGSSPSLFVQISFQFLAVVLLLLAPL